MPKEITHFALARTLGRAVSGSSLFFNPITRYPHLFCLGAVTPDIPYFYLAGGDRKRVQALSSPFHRHDAAALVPVLRYLDRFKDQPPALALAAGVICHILSDTRFHPFVYYYAGMDGLHKGATGRHRRFETAMDLYFWHLYGYETSLYRVVNSIEIPRQALDRYLAALFNVSPLPEKVMSRSLNCFMGLQYLFRSSAVRSTMAFFKRMNRPLPENATGVVYPFGRPVPLPFFTGTVRYRDPCTGEDIKTDIRKMVDQTVASAKEVLDLVGDGLLRDRPLAETVLPDPDLPFIRPDFSPETFRFWKGQADLVPDLYRGVAPPF